MNSKSKIKFRPLDSVTLLNTMQKAIQISAKIEAKCMEEDKPPYLLDRSSIPTDILYDITSCFEAMYERLQESELLEAGYPKTSKSTH